MKHCVISLESGKRYSWENRTCKGEGVYLRTDGDHSIFLLDNGNNVRVNRWSIFWEDSNLTGCPEIDSANIIYRDDTTILTLSGETIRAYKLFQSPTTLLYDWLYRATWSKMGDQWVKRGVLRDYTATASDYMEIVSATR